MEHKMPSKLRIKVGSFEIEYEGDDAFIKDQLPSLLVTLQEFRTPDEEEQEETSTPNETTSKSNGQHNSQTSTNTVAQKLGAKSGSDLLTAAAVRLGIVLNNPTFTRKDAHTEMKSATSFYKKSFANNLDNYFKTLLDNGTLLLQADSSYSLSQAKRQELEKKIA
jgi:hypothetical protein